LLPKQANAISELEISIASLRLVDRPNSKNRVVVNKEQPFVDKHVSHGGATDKVVTNQTGDDTWAYNESIKEYTLPRPRMESAEQWPIVRIPKSLYDKLFDFQRTGVCWMALLHAKRIGGILGDDMGMGKTYTTLAFLGGLLKGGMIKNALIVSPVTVLRSWESEAHKIIESCISGVNISVVSSDNSKNERNRLLREGYER
jgi:SNF2 family DNA or RNA helicase